MIQKDSTLAGSTVQITTPSTQSKRKRRQIWNILTITFDLYITCAKSCPSATCENQCQSHAISCLSNSNQATPTAGYQQTNSSQIYWLEYRLPQTIQSSKISYSIEIKNKHHFILDVSLVIVDSQVIASTLAALLQLDNTENQPTVENSTTTLFG